MFFMAFFNKRKDKVIDLTERYVKEKERIDNIRESMQEDSSSESSAPSSPGIFGMFGGGTPTPSVNTTGDISDAEEKRKRLGKRLMDMTEKIEDQANQIYKLQQRVELLERKSRVDY